jgi:hypothetical protein
MFLVCVFPWNDILLPRSLHLKDVSHDLIIVSDGALASLLSCQSSDIEPQKISGSGLDDCSSTVLCKTSKY